MNGNAKKQHQGGNIAQNKKARFDYFLEEKIEAGLALQGWEVKSLRQGKCQLVDSYVLLKNNEAWLIGALISPLDTVSTHYVTDPRRTRKLLLSRRQINHLIGATQQKGYTCVCTSLYWKGHLVKAEIALAKGKQLHDKRDTEKDRDWDREKQRIVRESNT